MEFLATCVSEEVARTYLEELRWPGGVACPHCGLIGSAWRIQCRVSKSGQIPRKGLWKCSGCRRQFTVTVGTILENSKIPLHKWLIGVYFICQDRNGVSFRTLHSEMGITLKSAYAMERRIRYAQKLEPLRPAWASAAKQRAALARMDKLDVLERCRIQEVLAMTRKQAAGVGIPAEATATGSKIRALSLWPLRPAEAMSALLRVKPHSVLNF